MVQFSERITVESGKCGGRPCIRGMRIRVIDILDMLASGASRDEILTDFGWIGVVLNRWMPTDELLVAEMSVVKPVLFEVPGMGVFFTEQKPSDGSTIKMAIYGEIGLKYGPIGWHGKITNLIDS